MALLERLRISNLSIPGLDDSKQLDTPIRRNRSKSIDDVQRQMVRTYVTNRGAPRTDFPDPKVSRAVSWLRVCLDKLGQGSLDYSLLVFHKNNRFRRTVKRVVKSKFFSIFFGIVVLLNAFLLCVHAPTEWGDYKMQNIIVAYVSVVFLVAYIVESAMRIIAYGLIFHPKAYLRSAYNLLDLLTILFGFLYLFLTVAKLYVLADTFGAFMAIKLIRVLSVFKKVRFILRALAMSMVPLMYVSVMTLCVMIFFTFLGMELRQGCDLHSGCFANYTNPNGALKLELVSDFPCQQEDDGPLGSTLGVHQCPGNSQCIHWEQGPHYGFTSFDNFLLGLLTVFQLITLEGWSGVFYLYESACGIIVTSPYFIIAITLGSVLFLNLWMGVLTSVFIGVSERQETETNIRQLKEKKKNDRDLENYHKWIQKSLELDLPSESGSIGRRPSLPPAPPWLMKRESYLYDSDDEQYLEAQLDLQRRASVGETLREQSGDRRPRLQHWLTTSRSFALKVVKSRVHYCVLLLVLTVNLVLLMSLHYPFNRTLDKCIFTLNYILSCFFILESFLSLFALGLRRYISSQFHRVDLALNFLNFVDLILIPVVADYHFGAIINACRSIKLIKLFKYTRYWVSMKQIIHTFTQLFTMSASLMGLVVLFLFMWTVVGHRLFGERLDVDRHVGLPNFDNLFSSFLLVFQLMTTEDWHNVYYAANRSWLRQFGADYIVPIYFTSAITLGGFVLLSIFLSIAVDKLSEVKSVEEAEGREVEKKDKERKDKKRHINALKHPEEASLYRKTLRSAKGLLRGITVDSHQKKDWQKPFHSHNPVIRHLSGKSVASVGTPNPIAETPGTARKQSNPLRFMMGSLGAAGGREYSVERVIRETSREGLDTDHSVGSGTGSESTRSKSKSVQRKLSTLSSPDTPSPREFDLPPPESYEHSQSVPMGAPLMQRPSELSSVFEQEEQPVPKLETITEDNTTSQHTDLESQAEASTVVLSAESARPCPVSPVAPVSPVERAVALRGVHEQSSLENVINIRRNERERATESTDDFVIPESKWKQRIQRMWHWFTDYIGTIQFDPNTELAEIPNHSAFFILSPENSFRVFCYKLVCSKAFNVVTYVTIFLGSVLLTLEIPITSSLTKGSFLCLLQEVIIFVDVVIVVYFLVEMFLKMTALGVILHRGSYLRSFFNILDFIITITTLIPIISYFHKLDQNERQRCLAYSYQEKLVPVYLATLRVFRVLRPMRAIRITSLYVVVTGLLSSIKSIWKILFINVLVLSIFAVIGTILFRGSFFYCTDPNKETERECRGHFFTYPTGDLSCPELNDRRWLRHGLNFDNFAQSFLTLFAMITSEGWQDVMYNALNAKLFQDSNDPVGPKPYASPYTFIYFLLFMSIMTLVLLNMFIGFVIVTFQEVGIKAFRESKLDRNQRNCLYFTLTTKPMFRYVPKFEWQENLQDFISHPVFSAIIAASLLCNSILLALQGFERAKVPIYWFNFFFTFLFSVEAILKIIALHPVNYFKKVWNFVEFLSTTCAILEFILQWTVIRDTKFQYSHFASSFRVLLLLRYVPQVRLIMWTVIKSLEIFPWIGLLLLVFIFSQAVIGMQVFGTIDEAPIEASVQSPGTHITVYNSFANFPQALLVMIRVATGENWPDIMLSCKNDSPCDNPDLFNKCGSDFTYVFFPFFYFIASILFLNLFVAIIIDNFDYLVRDKSILGAHQLSVFAKLWSIYDPSASGELSPEEVIKLMKQCNPPVGWGTLCPRVVAYRNMMSMNIPLVNGKVTFHATLFSLVKTSLDIGCPGCPDCLRVCNAQLKEKLTQLFPTVPCKLLDEVLPDEHALTVRPSYAVHLIQTRWRAFVRRRNETIQLFQGREKRSLKAGPRRLPDAGPELVERKLSDFELEDLSALPSPPAESRKLSSSSAARTLTPGSVSGVRFSIDSGDERRSSDVWREVVPVSPLLSDDPFPALRDKDDLFPALRDEDDPFSRQRARDEDEQSELSYTSAYGTPSDNPQSFDQQQETTV